jgi:conjugal transfer pilus assembly protein TraK
VKTCAWLTASLLLLFDSAVFADDTVVLPEQSTAVVVSNRDVNRIYCSKEVEDVVWSKEKPVTVKVTGGNVFVKFMVMKQGDSETHVTGALDVHVVCAGEVYTLILHPRETDSVTVRLGDSTKKELAAVVKDWGSLALEDKVKRLTLIAYRHETPSGFSRRAIESADPRANIRAYKDLQIQGQTEVVAPGTGLRATEYTVIAGKAMTLSERDFLLKDMGDIVAVTVDPLYVAAQGASRIIVISRSTSDER